MKRRNVGLIFASEIRDQFRDRRTLFMMLVLPILLYPGMGVGMLQMTVLFSNQEREVVILGNENLPESSSLIEGDRFNERFFKQDPGAVNTYPLPAVLQPIFLLSSSCLNR